MILTDVKGLYDSDPRKNKGARLIKRVEKVSEAALKQVAASPGSLRGTGGMYSKLKAAKEASKNGIETWLVKGDEPNVLIDVAQNAPIGTVIEAGR